MDAIKVCNQLAKQFNFESNEKLFETNQKIQKIEKYNGYYKLPFLTETELICCVNENNLFANYSKLHAKICTGQKFGNKICSQKFIEAFNQFLEICGEQTIDTKLWSQQKNNISKCLSLIDKKYYIQDTTNSKSPVSGVYLPFSFLHHFLNAFDLNYRKQVADLMNSIGLNALFSTNENKTTSNIVQTITNNNYEELTNQIKELQLKYENEHNKFIKADQERTHYKNECRLANEKYTNYFEEGETNRRAANICDSENRRLLSIIAEKNREIERLNGMNADLEKRNKKLTKRLEELSNERHNQYIDLKKEKAKEIEDYQKTIKETNEFISEIMQFIEPINKMLKFADDKNKYKNKLIEFMTDNNIIMKKTYKVYNMDYSIEFEKYTKKKTEYELQLNDIKNIDQLKIDMKKQLVAGFNELSEEEQLKLIDEEKYNNAVAKARKDKKRKPHKYTFIDATPEYLKDNYPEYFTEYYTLYNRLSKINNKTEETIQQKLDNLYVPVKYTVHYPKKDIEYKMRDIEVYSHEMEEIINFIRDKTVYDESDE